jgi:predicted membrane channel-forming protein YqfA (hemolysin III family)
MELSKRLRNHVYQKRTALKPAVNSVELVEKVNTGASWTVVDYIAQAVKMLNVSTAWEKMNHRAHPTRLLVSRYVMLSEQQ